MRNTDQFSIGKHHAGTLVAVIQQDFIPGRRQFVMQGTGGGSHHFAFTPADCHNYEQERCHGMGPDDALVVVMLFNRRCHNSRYADAVASHLHRLRAACFVQKSGVHGQ